MSPFGRPRRKGMAEGAADCGHRRGHEREGEGLTFQRLTYAPWAETSVNVVNHGMIVMRGVRFGYWLRILGRGAPAHSVIHLTCRALLRQHKSYMWQRDQRLLEPTGIIRCNSRSCGGGQKRRAARMALSHERGVCRIGRNQRALHESMMSRPLLSTLSIITSWSVYSV